MAKLQFQAFHAWLPSYGPYGTTHLHPYVDAHGSKLLLSRNLGRRPENRGGGLQAGAGSAAPGIERPLAFPTRATLPLAIPEEARCRVRKR